MDNNPNPYQFPNPQGQQSNVPPPPPSQDAQVGVRSMQSDLESIKQSGGEAPQSQIISAPELAKFNDPTPAQPSYVPPAPSVTSQGEPMMTVSEMGPKKSFNIKTILLIVGGLILAGVVGYGAYYLVTMLSATPAVVVPVTQTNLPVPVIPAATTTVVTPTPPPVVVVPPLVHKSLILNPTKSEVIQLANQTFASFEQTLASSSKEKLIVGSVKDLAFVNSSSTPVEAAVFLQSYFAPQAATIAPLIDKDFTSWLYYDKLGGAKFGTILKLKDGVTISQASSTLSSIIESAIPNIETFFISNPPLPTAPEFKGGVVETIPVRFLVYNAKNSDVFEYAWMTAGGNNYLVMATSYNQMVDIIKRLKALPTQTTTTTTTTTTSTTTTTGATTTNP
jgi:hypothetical protein